MVAYRDYSLPGGLAVSNTRIHPTCAHLPHLVDLHLWRGAPENLDATRPIEILVNHGYVVGFCPDRLQPAWSAYRVAYAKRDTKYERPITYYDDMRLPAEQRIGHKTFGKIGGVQLNVGHMTPNEVINLQFGRLAQLETFLMSNMSPQYAALNSGVWLKLEDAIRDIKDEEGKDHVWAVVGPVFGDQPASINRGQGKYLPIPEAYFCVVVDPHQYPYDTLSRVALDCYLIPQSAPRASRPEDYPATLEEIEGKTKLKFFPSWGKELALLQLASEKPGRVESRLRAALRRGAKTEAREAEEAKKAAAEKAKAAAAAGPLADGPAQTIDGLIAMLAQEVAEMQLVGRALTDEELARLTTLQHTISWLLEARERLLPPVSEPVDSPVSVPAAAPPEEPPNLITYLIVKDLEDRLRQGARTACNFWNRFLEPKHSIVIRLGTFTENSRTIAAAWEPYFNDDGDTKYGRVEFNTKYLAGFSADEIAGTIIHEIGHTLGIGWDDWFSLFDKTTGKFTEAAATELASLGAMEVERGGGSGTRLSHWDEELFDRELMTGFQDKGEHVLPVTIEVMRLFGHALKEEARLESETPLVDLLRIAESQAFFRQVEAKRLDLEYFEETELLETIPHEPQAPNHEE